MKKIILILLAILFSISAQSQSANCNTATPFCTNSGITFPASTGTSSPNGPDYGCLSTQPNPAFFYLQIDNPGNMTLSLFSTPANDIDFICWGPFSDPNTMCNNLTSWNIEDCSYSWVSNETCQINGASTGDYYVILITNYSNSNCNINFNQIGGSASTNCCVMSNIDISETLTNISCNGLSDGSINLNITGGIPPFSTLWSNTSTTQNISNLVAGTYTTTITDDDGCTANETFTLTEPPTLNPTVNTSNVSCFGSNDGLIEVVNEPATTTYQWSNASSSSSITNIGPGYYSVDVFNMNGCLYTENFTITEPTEIIVTSSLNDVSCFGLNDGNIDLVITGGIQNYTVNIPPYSQVLSAGATNYYSQSVLSPGTYNYLVTDDNGCTATDLITINEPSQLAANPLITNVLCKDELNGSITLNASGGTLPYIEDFGGNNPLQLANGNYTYTVTDNNGCTVTSNFTITEPDSLLFTINKTDVSCAGYNDGTASLSITGGTLAYNTNWNGSNPNGLTVGQHNFTITDGNGCVSSGSVMINEPPGMALVIDESDVSCFGGNDGSASLTVSGGAGAPYNIYWGGVDENNLSAGNFPVTVSDINNCSTTGNATINEPSEIQVTEVTNNVSCFGLNDGNTSLQISGGITPYTEDWFGININLLAPGNYPYQLNDGNNCIKNGNINITEPELLEIISIDVINVDCYGENTGLINPNIIGGTIPYSQDFGMFNPNYLPAGDYPFSVTDANGCSTNSIATITQSEEIFLDFIATSPICRYDESTLSIHISNSNFNSYTVSLQDSILKSYTIDTNGLLIATGLPIILTPNFSCDPVIISLTDEYGCTAVVNDNVHIEVKQLPVLAVNEPDICIGTPSFTLVNATPTGGSYKIEGVSTDFFDASNLNPGNYNISYSYTDLITSCSNQIADIITISDSPKAGMIFSPQPANISDPNIYFRDNSNEEVLISEWDLGDGTIIYDDLSFWHTYDDIGSYTIRYYITNLYGCTDSVVEKLNINPNYSTFIPNSFTPNNDGDNDVFFPNSVGYKTYNIKIFDRWGGIIYDEDDLAWDGNNNGKIIGGLYSYTINILDFKDKPFIYTGLVNLIR